MSEEKRSGYVGFELSGYQYLLVPIDLMETMLSRGTIVQRKYTSDGYEYSTSNAPITGTFYTYDQYAALVAQAKLAGNN